MSRNVTHGKSPEQRTANHEKRLLAIERNLAAQAGVEGVPDLREALFVAADVAGLIRGRNYDPALATTQASLSTTGATRYCAAYWPGGVCTGMAYLVTATISGYTDAAGRSGTALYSNDGTTLTQQAALNTKLNEAVGVHTRSWTTAAPLNAGVYYVGIRLVFSAGTPTLGLGSIQTLDSSVLGDPNNVVTPSGWALSYLQTDATQALPATQAISGLTIPNPLIWVGLF